MSRFNALAARPRRTLPALAVVLAAVGITVGSGADFTASSANAGNAFTTGTLLIADGTSGAVLTASGLKPGDTTTGTVDIQNTGSLTGAFGLGSSSPAGDTDLLDQLDLTVKDCGLFVGATAPSCAGASTVLAGSVNIGSPIGLGDYAPNAKHRYEFTATLPQITDDTFQGRSATITFDWSATAV
jgi:spore coat-associated protein N